MGHHHDHHHHGPGHAHGHHNYGATASERRLAIAAVLTGGFMLAELAGGLLANSLALIADAGHMLTDFASLLLAWFALRLGRRPASWKRTYGFDRFSVLAAFVNGIALFVIAGWIIWEAAERLRAPDEVAGGLMLGIAAAGLVVNVAAFLVLSRGEERNLNIRAATLHVAGDLLGSVAAIVAGLVILLTGWTPVDPILSVLVAVIILRSAWRVVAESGHILLEGAPPGIDPRHVAGDLAAHVPGVVSIDHVHAWAITEARPMLTLEAAIESGIDPMAAKAAIKARLRERFRISHATVEVCAAGEAATQC